MCGVGPESGQGAPLHCPSFSLLSKGWGWTEAGSGQEVRGEAGLGKGPGLISDSYLGRGLEGRSLCLGLCRLSWGGTSDGGAG